MRLANRGRHFTNAPSDPRDLIRALENDVSRLRLSQSPRAQEMEAASAPSQISMPEIWAHTAHGPPVQPRDLSGFPPTNTGLPAGAS